MQRKCVGCPYNPWEEFPVFDVKTTAYLLQIKRESVYRILNKHKAHLKPPTYRLGRDRPTKRRLLYASDIRYLFAKTTRKGFFKMAFDMANKS